MSSFIPLDTTEPQTSSQYAGMTQIVNISNKTLLVDDSGHYLFPKASGLLPSTSEKLKSLLSKGGVKVVSVIDGTPASSQPSPRKKKAVQAEEVQEQKQEEVAESSENKESVEDAVADIAPEVAPEEPKESL